MHARPSPSRQRGLTLVEFMVSIGLGMLLVAALATLIADQSQNRAEVDRSGRLIESGRFAIRTMADDLQMAGYWGELNSVSTSLATIPDPCSTTVADMEAAMALHVQGYDAPAASDVPTCLSNQKTGTDILVVRRADPDSSSLETGGVPDLTKLVNGQVYIQTGLTSATQNFTYSLKAGSGANATNFPLLKKDLTTLATIRKFVTHIYYISTCSVPSGGSCAAGDNGSPIPTLKMAELTVSGGAPAWNTVTIAEGIENLQVDYGQDTDSDGVPNGTDVSGSSFTVANWQDVMSVKVYLLARSPEATPGYSDDKTYTLGTAGTTTATGDTYKRHVFVQSVRLVNPSGRRM